MSLRDTGSRPTAGAGADAGADNHAIGPIYGTGRTRRLFPAERGRDRLGLGKPEDLRLAEGPVAFKNASTPCPESLRREPEDNGGDR